MVFRLIGMARLNEALRRLSREHDLMLEFEAWRDAGFPNVEEPQLESRPLVLSLYRRYRRWQFRRAVRRMPPIPPSFFEFGSS